MDWKGLEWIGMDRNGLEWIGMDWNGTSSGLNPDSVSRHHEGGNPQLSGKYNHLRKHIHHRSSPQSSSYSPWCSRSLIRAGPWCSPACAGLSTLARRTGDLCFRRTFCQLKHVQPPYFSTKKKTGKQPITGNPPYKNESIKVDVPCSLPNIQQHFLHLQLNQSCSCNTSATFKVEMLNCFDMEVGGFCVYAIQKKKLVWQEGLMWKDKPTSSLCSFHVCKINVHIRQMQNLPEICFSKIVISCKNNHRKSPKTGSF